MDHEEPIHSGFLLLPPVGKILLKKSWQQKYCLLFKSSKFGIERLEVYDSSDTTKGIQSRIITLENCIKITSKSSTYFTITTKTAAYEFGALTTHSMNEWISAIQSVAFPDDVSKITSIEEDNDLYCSSGEGVFNVKLHHSPASQRCGLDDEKIYTLLLTPTAIQLRNSTDAKLLYTWPYCFIRRYGYKSGKFTFEAGRKCESGEGTFFLEHSNQQEIFRCLASKMKSMKKLLNADSTPSLLDADNQFHAALSMEARSRSPLPPSVTSSMSTSILDKDANLSTKSSVSSESSRTKPVPSKPPRKFLNMKPENFGSLSDYEPIDKYDHIEYRSDAWRTLGINEIKHTEQIESEDEEEVYTSWGGVKNQVKKIVTSIQNKAPKIITQNSHTGDNSYDKLNFFGSSSKLNANSGYKQVLPTPVVPVVAQPSFNEYDEVQPWQSDEIRLADDSHLGYALIRKEAVKETAATGKKDISKDVNHQFHNNEPYAVISKPKRV